MALHERDLNPFRKHAATLGSIEAQTANHAPLKLPTKRAKLFYRMTSAFVPNDKDVDVRAYYSVQYKYCPPPIFIPLITLIHIVVFALIAMERNHIPNFTNGNLPLDSLFMFRSDKRHQIWRYVLYSFVHAGWWHLIFNIIVQLVIGIPLEMVHGCFRVSCVYIAGVIAGSLATGLLDSDVYLIGASGGVYALLTAHVANVLLNYTTMDCGVIWLFSCITIASVDVSFAIWDRYVRTSIDDHPVSYLAHFAGATAGLCTGFLVLKRFDLKSRYNNAFWWLILVIYCTAMLLAVVGNVLLVEQWIRPDFY